MARKGMEMPVNMLVIIAIAVIILVALIALLTIGIGGGKPIEIQLAMSTACSKLVNAGCIAVDTGTIQTTIKNADGTYKTLQQLCDSDFGALGNAVACMRECNCPGV